MPPLTHADVLRAVRVAAGKESYVEVRTTRGTFIVPQGGSPYHVEELRVATLDEKLTLLVASAECYREHVVSLLERAAEVVKGGKADA